MSSDDIKRLHYYERQFLRTRDFQDEQAYHIEMRRRHLIAHHIWGIVVGLEITQDPNSQIWSVQPGMAIDGFGREIVVFDAQPLETNRIAAQLAGAAKPAMLKVWIAYRTERANRPPPGYEVCDGTEQFMRVRETFRLLYQDDPPSDLQKVTDPNGQNPDDPKTWPRAFQDLPDDPGQARWPVYLGTLTWDTAPNNPSQNVVTKVDPVDPRDNKRRHYVGVVAEEIAAPHNQLLIRGRGNASPLPDDATKPDYAGVPVKLEGSLAIDRQLHVLDSTGIGIGTTKPDTKLHISGGTEATLQNGSGSLVIGPVSGKNMVLDDHTLMARSNQAKADLHLQTKGGDLVVHKDQAGTEFIVKDSGRVGIGTTNPTQLLTLVAPEGNRLEITRTTSELPWRQSDGHINEGAFVLNYQSQGSSRPTADFALMRDRRKRLQLGDADTYLSSQGGGSLRFLINYDETGAQEVMHVTGAGNVGIGTTTPGQKLDVAGAAHASSFPTSSDVRFKTNIKPLTAVLEKLATIRGVSFEWNELYASLGRSTGHGEIGVIAQEVEAVFPELVTTWGDQGYRAVDYGRLTAVLLEAIKELHADNQALNQRVEQLHADNQALTQRVEQLHADSQALNQRVAALEKRMGEQAKKRPPRRRTPKAQ